jgi:hypothetical protein
MDPMNEYLASATITERLAQAREQQPGRRIEAERRSDRRRRRRAALVGWWRGRSVHPTQAKAPRLVAAEQTPIASASAEVAGLLEDAAYRIAEEGTATERRLLEAMAQVASESAPGASAALVDAEGSEASRLRAYGVVHSHLLDELGAREHAWLLELVQDDGSVELPGRVA